MNRGVMVVATGPQESAARGLSALPVGITSCILAGALSGALHLALSPAMGETIG